MSEALVPKRKSVTLTLTNHCNLACVYCYEHSKNKKTMTFECAKRIIDCEFDNAKGFDEIEFDLFGGEPLEEFELAKQIIEYVYYHPSNLPRIVFASTNGTFLTDDMREYLKSHTDIFQCGLSYDGTETMQNINRCNSAELIDLDFFATTYPEQGIKMTVSQKTLPMLCEGIEYLHNKGFCEINCNLAYNIDWSDPENVNILQNQLMKLIEFYLKNPHLKVCTLLGNPIYNVATETKHKRWCGSGVEMSTYDVDGRKYPCQFFMPLSCGEEKAQKAKDIIFYDEEIPLECIEEKCKQCVVHPACPTCFGANYVSTGDIYTHDEAFCKLTKLTILARSFFRAKQWELGQDIGENPEATLAAIKIIQEQLVIG